MVGTSFLIMDLLARSGPLANSERAATYQRGTSRLRLAGPLLRHPPAPGGRAAQMPGLGRRPGPVPVRRSLGTASHGGHRQLCWWSESQARPLRARRRRGGPRWPSSVGVYSSLHKPSKPGRLLLELALPACLPQRRARLPRRPDSQRQALFC